MQKIAVIGMSCLFPGASTPEQFMQNLFDNRDTTSAPTEQDMGADPGLFYNPKKGVADTYYSVRGGYIRDFNFDADAFDLPGDELAGLDEIYQWSLYVAREALRNSGYFENREARRACGVILGNLSFPTRSSNRIILPIYHRVIEQAVRQIPGLQDIKLAGDMDFNTLNYINSRIAGYPAALTAKALGLAAGHFAIDAACASSIYSVKLACDYLHSGRADLMLAGAVSAGDPFFVNMGFSTFTAYPESSESRPLDRNSGGLVSGEGAGMLVLKRYDDALRDDDHIYAVINGIGLSNDGRGKSVLSPNAQGQVLVYERAYADSTIKPEAVSYIECHATGTPVGDPEEIASLDQFFGRYGARPLIGSVKANFGHLLTAAGMASMIKVMLSMQAGRIPATIHLEDPVSSENGVITPQQVVGENLPWPGDDNVRYGAVNAFGFGGSNAHVIFEHSSKGKPKSRRKAASGKKTGKSGLKAPMAIVGMAAHFSSCSSLEAFDHAIYSGSRLFRPLPEKRWKGLENRAELLRVFGFEDGEAPHGAYIEDFDFDVMRYRIPPSEVEAMIPQQLLMMSVADAAIRDAQVKEGTNVAVLVAMESDLSLHQFRGRIDLGWKTEAALAAGEVGRDNGQLSSLQSTLKDAVRGAVRVNEFTSFIGNIMACRIAALWDFSGPAFTVSSEENAVFRALEMARMLLASGEVEAVVVGGVDLSGNPEDVLIRNRLMATAGDGDSAFSFEKNASGWMVGEGAGAVVLKLPETARKEKDRCYSVVEGLAFGEAGSVESIAATCRESMQQAGVKAPDIGYLEVTGSDGSTEQKIKALAESYEGGPPLSCALGSASANIGNCFTAIGMAGLIKTALSLYRRYLPAVPGWNQPAPAVDWDLTPFYVPAESRSWFPEAGISRRSAAIFGTGQDGACAHVVLSEDLTPRRRSSSLLAQSPLIFIPVSGGERADLVRNLEALRQDISATENPGQLASVRVASLAAGSGTYTAVIVGDGKTRLLQEIDAASDGIETAFNSGQDWISPSGSCFSPEPLAGKGKVAFVYPGAFNSYIGMGKDLFQLFPEMYDLMATYSSRPEILLRDRQIHPRSLARLSEKELLEKQAELDGDAIAIFESGINAAILNTAVARGVLGLQPEAVFGYSMGEVSMNFAMGLWESTDQMSETLHSHPIFLERLAGPMKAAREAWGLPPAEPGEVGDIWHCYTVSASADAVQEAIADEPHVYLTIVNSPQEVMIAGEREACARVVGKMPYRSVLTPMTDTIHCDVVKPDYDSITHLHTSPVSPVSGITFYSAAGFEPTEQSSETIADNIARIYCKTIDFPRLVNRVYDDGYRIFVEMGPRESCSRFISETLADKPHLAVSIDRKGSDSHSTLIRMVARLMSHGLTLDVSMLLGPEAMPPVKGLKAIVPGGEDMYAAVAAADLDFSRAAEPGKGAPAREAPENLLAALPGQIPKDIGQWPQIQHSISDHRSRISASHLSFLNARNASLQELRELIRLQIMMTSGTEGTAPAAPPPPVSKAEPDHIEATSHARPPGVIWDEADLLEFAGGKIANVFGEAYAVIDSYKYRVRLPLPPYLLVHRVTGINAVRGEFKPSTLTTEYDVPYNAWYSVDGQIPWAIASEAGQCDLLLISFLGIDFQSRGERYYRLTDYTMTFMDELPREGDTLRYEIRIESFMKFGEALFFNFAYDCYVGDRLVYKMTGGRAGFSTDEELAQGKGIVFSRVEEEERRNMPKRQFTPFLTCDRTAFDREALLNMTRGNIAACLGAVYNQQGANPSLRFSAEEIMMLDRIVSIDPNGGPWGLGEVVAEKDLAPDHWYFPCHFKDDNVLAGTLITEGCVQLLEFYMLYLGLQVNTRDARFQPVRDRSYVIRARGQIVPTDTRYSYRMEIIDVGVSPRPYARANFYIIMDSRIIVDFRDLGIEMVEKQQPAVGVPTIQPAIFVESHIDAFTTGSLSDCFGPDFDIYEGRQAPRIPNGDLQLMSRVLHVDGQRYDFSKPSSLVSEYDVPADVWFYTQSAYPSVPYSMIMEIALQPCGFLCTYMGATMIYRDATLCYRNLSSDATLHYTPDLRGKTITAWSELLNVSKAAETIVLNYNYSLEVDGQRFYEGKTQFGYFTPHALSMQKGLDRGELIPPWSEREGLATTGAIEIDLRSEAVQARYFQSGGEKPYYRLNGPQLDFLDKAWVFEGSGKYGLGYILATKTVDPSDWFYPCHFYQDPVMPGSLGVEGIIQAIRIFALQQDLGREMKSPAFVNVPGLTKWIYRGQITPDNQTMDIEVHIKSVERSEGQVILMADANLWKDKMRIYEITDAAIALVES